MSCVFCLLFPLLLLCVKSHANTGAWCCQNTSEQGGVLFKISISWEESTCYLDLFGMATLLQPSGKSRALYSGEWLCSFLPVCPANEDLKRVAPELDPCGFLYAALKIYLNQEVARTFWRPLLCLGSSWEFTSFPPPRLGAVTYSARPAWHLFPPLPGRFHLCFKSKSCHQPEGSVCWAVSSTGLECWYILRYLRYFQIVSGVGRLFFSFGSLNSSENLETVAIFPGLCSNLWKWNVSDLFCLRAAREENLSSGMVCVTASPHRWSFHLIPSLSTVNAPGQYLFVMKILSSPILTNKYSHGAFHQEVYKHNCLTPRFKCCQNVIAVSW